MSRTVAQVHREAEGSLLATQLLLAQGALALAPTASGRSELPSARKVLLEIRMEIRNVTGMYLGPRQCQTYLQRLARAIFICHRAPRLYLETRARRPSISGSLRSGAFLEPMGAAGSQPCEN